jgi:FkbM family methyltransferase
MIFMSYWFACFVAAGGLAFWFITISIGFACRSSPSSIRRSSAVMRPVHHANYHKLLPPRSDVLLIFAAVSPTNPRMLFSRKPHQKSNQPELLPPILMDNAARAEMTVSCRDCDTIPKVPDSGKVISLDGTQVQIMHNGLRMVAGGYYGDWMTGIIERLRGHHEPQEEAVFHEILKHVPPAASMLELGGFWSYYSLWFKSQHSQQRQAYVIEPDPNHIAIGRANAALNDHDVTFIQAGVGAEDIKRIKFATESAGTIYIPQLSVSTALRDHRIARLDILHCDTQGAETAIVRSCEALFRSSTVRFGIFSTHSHHISGDPLTHQRCLAMLRDFGGTVLCEHDVHESFSGDGLVAVYFGREPLAWSEPPISRNRYSSSLFRNPLYDLAAKS